MLRPNPPMAVEDLETPVKVQYPLKKLDSISDFKDMYGSRLPQIVNFPKPYYPNKNPLYEIYGTNVILGTLIQKRIVIQGTVDLRFSLTLKEADELILYQNKKKSPYKLSEIISKPGWNIENIYKVGFKPDMPIEYAHDYEFSTDFSQHDPMLVVGCYDEKYMVSSRLTRKGGMPDSYCLVPINITLPLRVASGFTGMSQQDFHARLQDYRKNSNREAIKALEFHKGILVMSKPSEECLFDPYYVHQELNKELLKKIEYQKIKSTTSPIRYYPFSLNSSTDLSDKNDLGIPSPEVFIPPHRRKKKRR